MQAGDKNTAFFHRQCKARLSQNHISEIYTSEGEVIKGHSQLQHVAQTHFQQLLQEDDISDDEVNADFLSNIPSLVSAELNVGLVKPFSENEIVDVIQTMESDKAPRMDGFSFHFYRVCWNIIKSNIFRLISTFLKKSKVGGCTNSTFLALTPKEVNPASFDRFRPTSLFNASYKLLAKIFSQLT